MIKAAGFVLLLVLGCFVIRLAEFPVKLIVFVVITHWVRLFWLDHGEAIKKALSLKGRRSR